MIPTINTRYGHVNEFVNTLAPIVINEYVKRKAKNEHCINPSVCIAQACVESGYNLNASTLFGIKGNGVTLDTTEYINGEYVNVQDTFATYPDIAGAVQGYYDLMQWVNYKDATTPVANNWQEQIEGLTNNNGLKYATSPTYKDTVSSVIIDFNLEIFDEYILSLDTETETEAETETETETEAETDTDLYYTGRIVKVLTDEDGNIYDTDGNLCHCWHTEYSIIDHNDSGVCLGVDGNIFARIPYSNIIL